jgi:hypothetical protein
MKGERRDEQQATRAQPRGVHGKQKTPRSHTPTGSRLQVEEGGCSAARACVRPPADTAAVCGAAPCAYVLPAPTQRERRGGRGRAAWPRLALPRLRPSSPSPSQPRARARAVPSETVARGCPREPARPLCAARPLWLCPPPRRAPCDTAAGRAGGARVRGTDRGGRHQAESEAGGEGGGAPAGVARTYERTARPTDRPLARPRNKRRF